MGSLLGITAAGVKCQFLKGVFLNYPLCYRSTGLFKAIRIKIQRTIHLVLTAENLSRARGSIVAVAGDTLICISANAARDEKNFLHLFGLDAQTNN